MVKLSFTSLNLFKRKSAAAKRNKMDSYKLNEMAELRYRVEQIMLVDPKHPTPFRKGPNHRVIGISEDGIDIISKNESEIIESFEWDEIVTIKLQDNFIIWEIYLADERCLYFKSQNAFQLHIATDKYISTMIRNDKLKEYSLSSSIAMANYNTAHRKCLPRSNSSFAMNYQNDFDYIIH